MPIPSGARQRTVAAMDVAAHKAAHASYMRTWRQNNRWRQASTTFNFNSRRRMRQRGLEANYVEDVDVQEVYVRAEGRCEDCTEPVTLYEGPGDKRKPDLAHFDHRYPICLGGRHEQRNVQLLHQRCHLRKSYQKRNANVA